ncbi:MAG: protealysin inhibitor emfourin [Actinomycetota bacterium]
MPEQRLKIDFKRSGGVTGMQLTTCVDVDDLPEDEGQTVRDMVEQLDLEQMSRQPSGAGAPDRFVYELRIEQGERTVDVCLGEAELPEDLRPLVRDLEKRAKSR